MTEQKLHDDAIIVMETIEDSVEYICNEHFLSGEKVWVMVRALADANLSHFPTDD